MPNNAENAFNPGHYSQATELFTDSYQKSVVLFSTVQVNTPRHRHLPPHEKVKIDALYNLGNAYFQQGKFQETTRAYESVLTEQPDYEDAKQNLALAKQRLSTPNLSSQSQNSPQEKGNQNTQTGQNLNCNNDSKQSH